MKKKQLTIIILAIVAIIIATIAYSGRTQNVNSEEQIKIEKTVKQFIIILVKKAVLLLLEMINLKRY